MSFIIFSIAVAVVRNLYRAHASKNNIKKQIRKRFRKVFGDDQGVDNSGLMGPNGPQEEEKQPVSDDPHHPKGSVRDYLKTGVGKIMGKLGKK